ncbi:putative antirepressor [Alphaentomopoxvirus acuprea]|uniref:Putative antirepressor n=1 Tax=Alphaentomopoxvirus acuprea TaxID=62099 RepID=W6JII3_9POXV|nr:anti-repressor Ant [Anomala cuprea entomopoxvirus]YP_009001734.1 anti-repressor Ant [Anomala cuprea entomopoxvirus]BAO49363.1 putative antirepressor [Anomala cuprea entomopoxvirus]BAO49621.1 putative antirepressor [Anomala cuprea entomopoxvirus]
MENQLSLLNIDDNNTQLDYKSISSLENDFIKYFNNIFKYNDKEIKMIGTINDPYFKAKDILIILGYSNHKGLISKILSKLDADERKYLSDIFKTLYDKELCTVKVNNPELFTNINNPSYHEGKEIYVNESGLYTLIMNSKLENAKDFKKFIFKELLPSFRKRIHQKYLDMINNKQDKIDELLNETRNQSTEIYKLSLQNNQTLKKLEQLGISLEQSREENEELKDDIKNLSDDVKDISNELNETNNKLDDVLEDRNIKPADLKLQHKYMLLKSKQNENEFTFIRSQKKYIDKNILKWNTEFEIIINEKDNPNPTDLCTRLKEKIKNVNKLKYEQIKNEIKRNTNLTIVEKRNKINLLNKDDYIKINRNVFILNQCTELEFINLVKEFDNHKYDL